MTSKIWMACAGTVVLLASVGTSGCGQSSSGSPPVEGLGGFPVLDAGVDDGGGAEQRHSDGAASDGSAAEAGPNNGTMRFTLANPVGTTLTNTAIEMPVTDSSCMGSGAKSQCSVTGTVTDPSCERSLNLSFAGQPAQNAVFALLPRAPAPQGTGVVTYTETCGTDRKSWTASSGTLTLSKIKPPKEGFSMGTMSIEVIGARMTPSPDMPGGAMGSIDFAGVASDVRYEEL